MRHEFSEHYFFTNENSVVEVTPHEYFEEDGKGKQNAHIEFDNSSSRLSISIPLDSFEKLIIEGKRFLEMRNTIGERQENVLAKEA
jgi:hypothetical protein